MRNRPWKRETWSELCRDQLIAFCVSGDQDRQRQVFERLGEYRPVHAIRRAMTKTKVRADDRRAIFVGVAAYEAEGGTVPRDLETTCAKLHPTSAFRDIVLVRQRQK